MSHNSFGLGLDAIKGEEVGRFSFTGSVARDVNVVREKETNGMRHIYVVFARQFLVVVETDIRPLGRWIGLVRRLQQHECVPTTRPNKRLRAMR